MEELRRVRFPGQGGAEIEGLFAPAPASGAGAPPAVLLVHGAAGLGAPIEDLARRFAGEGFAALAPDLRSREGSPPALAQPSEAAAVLPLRRALADLEAGLGWLEQGAGADPARLAAVGLGMGGTLAFLLGCASRRLAAAVSLGGPVAYPALSAARPIQPLEMALNLSCPLLALFWEGDPSVPREDVERLRQTLSQFARTFEIETLPGSPGGFLGRDPPGYHGDGARDAWERCRLFLREHLELD